MPPIRARHLLGDAERLAGRLAGRGRPRDLDLRRAVSCAYYGLFHLTSWYVADQVAPGQGRVERDVLRRTITHAGAKRVGGWVAGMHHPPVDKPALRALTATALGAPNLAVVGAALVALQEARHSADYDHLWIARRSDVLRLVDVAQVAAVALRDEAGTPAFEAFGLLMLMKGTS